MYRSFLAILLLVLVAVPVFGQSPTTDSQTLQALLAEVRQLRKDLQTTTVAAQRAQILLYRLQAQEVIVARASQHLDEARVKLVGTQSERKKFAANVKQAEEFVSHTENPAADRKQIEDALLPQQKAKLESLEAEEQRLQANEMEAQDQLRAERARLSDLHDQLDRLQRILESSAQQPTANPH